MYKVFSRSRKERRGASEGASERVAASDHRRVHASEAKSGQHLTASSASVRNGRSASHHEASFDSSFHRNGQVVPADQRFYDTAWSQSLSTQGQHGGFSESSSYETREHFERKVRKKTRSERERLRSAANGLHTSNGSLSTRRVSLAHGRVILEHAFEVSLSRWPLIFDRRGQPS